LQDVQPGIGALLERFAAVPVGPVIEGTHAAMPPGAALPRPSHAVMVTFGAPLAARELEGGDDGQAERRPQLALQRRSEAASPRWRVQRPTSLSRFTEALRR